jgi:4,5-DOPA dioxygenase extradiol
MVAHRGAGIAMTPLHPALFIGHGSPMMAIEPGPYTEAWVRIGRALPRPRAILAVSAHWYTRGTAVTAMERPKTIHDFYGFPDALYQLRYPASGDPQLARRVRELLAPTPVLADTQEWGLDHGTWSVLRYLYPEADVPVVQLSMDGTLPAQAHLAFGQRLQVLRAEGVLVLGSGNVVHNLRALDRTGAGQGDARAVAFDAWVRQATLAGDHAALADYASTGDTARWSVPTPDHYLPLLYVLGTQQQGEPVSFPVEGFDLGALSMLAVQVGGNAPS